MEQNAFISEGTNVREKLLDFHKNFTSTVAPENGGYGIKRIDKGNGLEAVRGKTSTGHPYIEYYQDGKLTMRRESLGNHQLIKQVMMMWVRLILKQLQRVERIPIMNWLLMLILQRAVSQQQLMRTEERYRQR